jgi:ATP-binding cassette subfamily B protein RaxB
MNHLFRLPAEFVNRRHTGDLMSKLESLTPVREAITEHVINSIVHGGIMLTTLAIMFLYSGWLTAVSLAGFTLSALVLVTILPASRRLREQAIIHTAAQNTSLVESLRAYDVVQALGLEHLRLAHWQNHFFDATNARIREGKLSIAQKTGTGVIGVLEQVLFLGVGIAGVLDKNLTLGVLFAFMSLRSRFGSAVLGLAEAIQKFFMLKVHTSRLSDIVLAKPVPTCPAGAITSTIKGSIRAEKLAFAYTTGAWIVQGFDCNIAAGSNVVITGPSGCGKTTLLKLLAGQLSADFGQIYIDNMEMSLWHRDSLRRQTGFVMQNDALFQGSVTENITAFDTRPDLARLREAAVSAEIWQDIQLLPMKLQTQVSDMGKNLSGGQVQRLLLARALYRKPAVLFLDEATSHLDVGTERRVLQNISELGITIVSVAHRPDAISRAQQIIRMDQ